MATAFANLRKKLKDTLDSVSTGTINVRGNVRAISNPQTRADWSRGMVSSVEKRIPGGFEGARQRLKEQQVFNPIKQIKGFSKAAAPADYGTKTKQLFTPVMGEKNAGRLGYGLQGATQVTPFFAGNMTDKNYRKKVRFSAPKTQSDKTAQTVGRTLYGTALTAPIGGASKAVNVAKNLTIPTVTGAGLGAGIAKITGQDVKEGAKQGAYQGFKSAPVLAVTNPVIEGAISKLGGGMLAQQVGGRITAGLGNVLEDEILANLDGVDNDLQSRVLSFAIAASLQGNKQLYDATATQLKKIGIPNPTKTMDKIARIVRQPDQAKSRLKSPAVPSQPKIAQPRNALGQFAKIAGTDTSNPLFSRVSNLWANAGGNMAKMSAHQKRQFTEALFELSDRNTTTFNKNLNLLQSMQKPTFIPKSDGTGLVRATEPAYGVLAGIEPEYDEEGRVTGVNYDATKGMTGVAGLMGGKKALKYADGVKFSSLLDKKPRFEIDDSGAKIKLSGPLEVFGKQIKQAEEAGDFSRIRSVVNRLNSSLENNQFLLRDILDHDELYKNYPNLRDVRVTLDSTRSPGSGSFSPSTNTITISGNPFAQKDLFLHEIQHAIQEVEGFAKGGSPDLFKVDLNKRNNEIVRRIKEMRDTPGFTKTLEYQRLKDEQNEILDRLFSLEGREGIDKYQRLSGELEARAVQRRMDMSQSQRVSTDPYAAEAKATTGTTNPIDFITKLSTDLSEFAKKDIQQANFGKNYTQFKNKPSEAIEHLLSIKNGEVKGAIHKPGLGDIDFVYGKAGSDGYGLAHIAEKHPEIIRSIPKIIQNGSVINQAQDRLFIQDSSQRAIIRLDWNGKDKKWLVTAFEAEKNLAPQASTRLTSKSSPITSDSGGAMVNDIIPQDSGYLNTNGISELRGEVLKSEVKKKFDNLMTAETPEEAVRMLQDIRNTAIQTGDKDAFQVLKRVAREYKSNLGGGAGIKRNPEYNQLYEVIDEIDATSLKEVGAKVDPFKGGKDFVTPQEVLDKRAERLDQLLNDATRLRQMGYSKKQIDKIGAKEARSIIENGINPFSHPTFEGTRTGTTFKGAPEDYGVVINERPRRIAGDNKVRQTAPTDEEVDRAVAEGVINAVEKPTLVKWFNRVFNPLNNAPESVQRIMKDWRNETLASRARANEAAVQFKNLFDTKGIKGVGGTAFRKSAKKQRFEEEMGWKLAQYAQNPTAKTARSLGIDPSKHTQQISQLRSYFDQIRQEGIDAGLDIKYLDNYINQVWKESPQEIDAIIRASAGKNPIFTKKRNIPNYQAGISIGLTPKFTHPAQLAAHYRRQLDNAIANRKMADKLIDTGMLLPSSNAPADWKAIESPFFPKVVVDFGEGETIQMDYKAPPEIAQVINNIFEVREPGFLSTFGDMSAKLQNITLSGGIPWTPINSFTMANFQKDILAGRVRGPVTAAVLSLSPNKTKAYFDANNKYVKDMASEGIRTNSSADYSKLYKNVVDNKNLWQKSGNAFSNAFDKPTFERFMPMLQVEFYKDVYNGAIKNGMDEAAAKSVAGRATKNFYGLSDAFSRSGQTSDGMKSLMLAPQFREAMFGFWRNVAKSINPLEKGGKAGVRFTAKNLKDPALAHNRKFIAGMAVTFGLYNLANFALNGRFMNENKDGKDLALEIPIGNGRSFYIPFLFTIGTVPRRFAEAGSYLAGGDVAGAAERMSTFASMPIQTATPLLTNRTFYGGPIYQEDDPAHAKVSKLAGYGIEQVSPGPIGAGVSVAQGRKSAIEAAPAILEAPLYPSSSTDTAHLRGSSLTKFRELNERDPKLATAYAQEQKRNQDAKELLSDQKKQYETLSAEEEPGVLSRFFGKNKKDNPEDLIDVTKLDLDENQQKEAIKEKMNLGYPVSTDEYMVHFNLNKYLEEPTDRVKAARQSKKKWSAAQTIYDNEDLNDNVKSALFAKLGVNESDVAYYDIANDDSKEVKRIFVEEYIINLPKEANKLEELALLRRTVRGERILSDNVIKELVKYGYLNNAEGSQLKNVVWDEDAGKLVAKKGKSKKLSINLTKANLPVLSGYASASMPNAQFSMGSNSRLSLNMPSTASTTPKRPGIRLMSLPKAGIRLADTYYSRRV